MPKVVIDANVIVSALFGGIPRKAFLTAMRTCDIYVSRDIKLELFTLVNELEDKLDGIKLRRLRSIISSLLSDSKEVVPMKRIEISRDKKDNAYLNLCLRVKADFLLTGDKDLLEIPVQELKSRGMNRLKIVSPKMFLSSV
ncbi:MAG: putative toxin-antitoxin system toxin component, PIN family [Nitrospirae bacterium]|nr:putative toxin-antitoxin system toxin component, PIN family [Nitrospirota bacterium]